MKNEFAYVYTWISYPSSLFLYRHQWNFPAHSRLADAMMMFDTYTVSLHIQLCVGINNDWTCNDLNWIAAMCECAWIKLHHGQLVKSGRLVLVLHTFHVVTIAEVANLYEKKNGNHGLLTANKMPLLLRPTNFFPHKNSYPREMYAEPAQNNPSELFGRYNFRFTSSIPRSGTPCWRYLANLLALTTKHSFT